MIESDRMVTAHSHSDEERQDRAIRPKRLADYIGQKELREQMEIFIQAATARQEALGSCVDFRPSRFGQNDAG